MSHFLSVREHIAPLQARLLVMLALLIPLERLEAAEAQEIPAQLTACGDEDGFPPYSYFERSGGNSNPQSGRVIGYNVDLLQELFAPLGHSVEFTLLPWPRCLALVGNGDIDMAMDVSRTPDRDGTLQFPRAHYSTTTILIQSRQATPETFVSTPADLERQRICIINGWTFAALGMSANARPSGTPLTPAAAADMLRAGRCNVLPYAREALLGNSLLDPAFPLAADEFTHTTIPWEVHSEKHIAVGRTLPYGERLVELLDQGIARLLASGAAERILQRYLQR